MTTTKKRGHPPAAECINWKAERDTLQELVAKNWTLKMLAQKYGCSIGNVRGAIQRLGIRTVQQTLRAITEQVQKEQTNVQQTGM